MPSSTGLLTVGFSDSSQDFTLAINCTSVCASASNRFASAIAAARVRQGTVALEFNADDARRPVRFALPQKEHLGTQRESACSLVHEHVGPRFDRGYYPFVAGTTSDDVRSALGRCPELRQENATFWNWISPEKPARILGKQKLPLKSQAFISTLGDGSLVLGSLELEDKALVLSANSRARSDRGRALLSKTLGSLVGQPLVKMQSVEQLMASQDRTTPPMPNMSEEERRAIIHDSLDRHYRNLLDQPIPVLGNKSPRAAVRTAKGRVKVVDWLKTLENHAAESDGRNGEIANYSFNWIWTELGVAELRR
jgi:hypothetical protein